MIFLCNQYAGNSLKDQRWSCGSDTLSEEDSRKLVEVRTWQERFLQRSSLLQCYHPPKMCSCADCYLVKLICEWGEEQIASCAFHLAIVLHFMFTNELVEEMAPSRLTDGWCAVQACQFVSLFSSFTSMNWGGKLGRCYSHWLHYLYLTSFLMWLDFKSGLGTTSTFLCYPV